VSTVARVALVTGAARRVGREIALELSRTGYDIAVHYRSSRDDAESLADAIRRAGRRAELLPADLALHSAAAALVGQCIASLGRLDVLVNNAAIFERSDPAAFDPNAWQRTLNINLTAPAALCHAAAARMTDGGAIINLADISADRPLPGYLAYCVSKAGVVALTRGLARALAPRVRVNAVAPGVAEWPPDYSDELKRSIVARVPMQRAGTPADVAAAVRFLAHDASYVTGVILPVDGGRSVAW